jgi:hypothetical protein
MFVQTSASNAGLVGLLGQGLASALRQVHVCIPSGLPERIFDAASPLGHSDIHA